MERRDEFGSSVAISLASLRLIDFAPGLWFTEAVNPIFAG
jgi:hypothetical protein